MTTFRTKVTVPTTAEIRARLEAPTGDVERAEKEHAAAEEALAAARQRLAAATEAVEAMPRRVQAGEATAQQHRAAIDEQRSAALGLAPAESAVREARERVLEAHAAARAAVAAAARELRDELQGQADKLTPTLEALRELEGALANAARTRDELGNPIDPGLAALTWPSCRVADRTLRQTEHARDLAAEGLNQREWAAKYGVGGHGHTSGEAA